AVVDRLHREGHAAEGVHQADLLRQSAERHQQPVLGRRHRRAGACYTHLRRTSLVNFGCFPPLTSLGAFSICRKPNLPPPFVRNLRNGAPRRSTSPATTPGRSRTSAAQPPHPPVSRRMSRLPWGVSRRLASSSPSPTKLNRRSVRDWLARCAGVRG